MFTVVWGAPAVCSGRMESTMAVVTMNSEDCSKDVGTTPLADSHVAKN